MIETKFKHTDIGLVPEDWEVCPLSDIIDNYTGLTYSPEDVSEYGTLVLRSANIQNGSLSFRDNVRVNMNIPERAMVKNNDILVCVRNGSSYLIGKCAIIKDLEEPMAFGAFMTVLRIKGYNDYRYVFYAWQAKYMFEQIHGNSSATINQITNKDIDNLKIALPPTLSEQQRIASVLMKVDALISNLDKLIAKKQAIKNGAMQELLTGKKRLPAFRKEWRDKKLGDIGTTFNGLSGKSKQDFEKGNKKYITFLNVLNNPVLKPSMFEAVYVAPNEHQNKAIKGDLFFNTSSETPEEVGFCSMLGIDYDDLYLNSFCFGYRLSDSEVSPLYLCYYFRSKYGRDIMTVAAQGVTRYNISKSGFSELLINMPPTRKEQDAIVNVLSTMESEISMLEKKRNKYQQIKQGMMRDLLTGCIRLVENNGRKRKQCAIRTQEKTFDGAIAAEPSQENT